MRYPQAIKPGDVLAVVAPSFGATTEPYITSLAEAERALRALGFGVEEWPAVHATDGVGMATTPARAAQELQEAWCAPSNCALLSAGGGELMCEILPHLDFDTLSAAEPKWFMGMSDNSNLSFTLATLCDTASIYGPNAPAFGQRSWHASLYDALSVLRGVTPDTKHPTQVFTLSNYDGWQLESLRDEDHPLEPYHIDRDSSLAAALPDGQALASAKLEGRLLGGCLDVLQVLCGTRYDAVANFNRRYAKDGILWFLEACDLSPIGVRRAIFQLAQAGWFDAATGIMFGRPLHYAEESFGLTQRTAALTALAEAGINVPVLLDCDFGHLPPMLPLVVGAHGQATFEHGTLTLRQALI